MQLGAEAVFVGSGIFMKDSTTFADPAEAEKRARAIVKPLPTLTTLKCYLKSAKT
jgi:pyridoxal biosynthesis lyase PdxS